MSDFATDTDEAVALDLDTGEPIEPEGSDDEAPYGRTEDGTPKRKPGRKPKGESKRGGDEKPGARSARRTASDVQARLDRTLARLAEALEGRGDTELAGIIREDAGAISGGLSALTKRVVWLASPIVLVLAIAEPALAFGRIARVLGKRWAERRYRLAVEAEAAAAAQAAEAGDAGATWYPENDGGAS